MAEKVCLGNRGSLFRVSGQPRCEDSHPMRVLAYTKKAESLRNPSFGPAVLLEDASEMFWYSACGGESRHCSLNTPEWSREDTICCSDFLFPAFYPGSSAGADVRDPGADSANRGQEVPYSKTRQALGSGGAKPGHRVGQQPPGRTVGACRQAGSRAQ